MSKEEKATRIGSDVSQRTAYHKPEVRSYGDVRTLTLAVTNGNVAPSNFESSRRRGEDSDGERGGRRGD